ncbi:hypothetical protein HF265_35295 [Rhizobium leguminosarum]|uniref:hypothetical protein n=1 Tax=Rhizobium leguminosarum TaxID=384 RepID=UPI001C8FFE9E|nr:hypothetical protein [Rhizobium leguminosarum]MBY3034282.1 hypothetical protein [Rhizobium leguminosarum]
MQILDTRVGNVHEGTITVEFTGEGNEAVSVRMATDGSVDGDGAVRRAKALMLQIATFGDDDASETDEPPAMTGPEDDVLVTSPSAASDAPVMNMPRN